VLPVSDVIPRRTTAWLTLGLIVACAAIGLTIALIGPDAERRVYWEFGLGTSPFWSSALTATFIHDGWLHLVASCAGLAVFGPALEDRLGRPRLAAAAAGLAFVSALAWAQTTSAPGLPVVGAGGVIAGLAGMYLRLFPQSRVVLLVPLPRLEAAETPAWLFAGIWFVVEAISAVTRSTGEPSTAALTLASYGVPAALGALVGPMLIRRNRRRPDWWERRRSD